MQRGSPHRLGKGLLFFYFSFCSVARWGATFCSFRGIGEGGLRLPGGFFAGTGVPAWPDMRGGASPHPLHSTLDAGAPPCTGGILQGQVAPAPTDAGAPREHGLAMLGTRVTFVSRRKSPKACQGVSPLNPRGGCFAPPAASRTPSIGGSGTNLDGFATLTQ